MQLLSREAYEFHRSSPMREGVLCWYPFERDARSLDLTGGVLTDLLKSRCGQVALDGDDGGGFDYVVAVDPRDYGVDALKGLKARLGPHGRLLLAFENPFALRYWSGKSCPTSGRPYDSLFGRDNRAGRAEMRTRLRLAGFEGQKWYYPLTDHWLTREVYSEDYLPDEHLNQRFAAYIDDGEFLQFDERPLYREIIRGGAFEFMCGAYLVEARVCGDDRPCPVDYAAVTAYREPAKRFATAVWNDGTARKTPLHGDGRESARNILRNHGELAALGVNVVPLRLEGDSLVMPRLALPTVWDYWGRREANGGVGFEELVHQFDRIREAVYKAAATGKCYWELVPANCFYDEAKDERIFFDQEYCWENHSPDIAVARAILSLRFSPVFGGDSRAEGWLAKLRDRYGLAERWDEFSELAGRQTAEIFGDGLAALERISEKAAKRFVTPPAERCPRSGSRPGGKE